MGEATRVASLYGELSLRDSMTSGLRTARSGLNRLNADMRKTGANMRKMGTTMTTRVSLPLVAMGGYAVNAAIQWEDAFAGVRKTVDGTEEELSQLERGLRDLATSADSPVSSLKNAHVELAGVAEAAGQLGIQLPDILKFTETMGLLGMATNVTAEEAAVLTAQFANITGMDVGRDVDKFASALVWLGNNAATTESDILQLAQRIGLAGTNAGLSESDILAFSAAILSLGFAPERAGTSVTKFFNEFSMAVTDSGPALAMIQEISGIDPAIFTETWETDSKSVFLSFFDGLGKLDLTDQVEMLDALNITGTTQQQVIMALAKPDSIPLLTSLLEGSAEAFIRNTDAMEEGTKRAETTKGQMAKLSNNINDLAISIGERLLPPLNDFITYLADGVTQLQETNPAVLDLVLGIAVLAIAIGPLTWLFGGLIGVLATLGGALLAISLPVWGIILVVGLLGAAWATNFGGMRDWTNALGDALREKNIEGILEGIGKGALALPKTLTEAIGGAGAWQEGIDGWKTTLESIKQIILWLGNSAADIIGGINFPMPPGLSEIGGIFDGIANSFGFGGGGGGESSTDEGTIGYLKTPSTNNPGPLGPANPGGRATGGPVSANTPYIVGERGQELFVPNSAGRIIPNNAMGGGGSSQIVIMLDSGVLFEGVINEGQRRNVFQVGS